MSLKQNVYSVLILSSSDTFFSSLKDLLPESRFFPVQRARDCSSAGRILSEQDYDLILRNSPYVLHDARTVVHGGYREFNMEILEMMQKHLSREHSEKQ